jgi:tetratricopeptide (TPR) repeat protein
MKKKKVSKRSKKGNSKQKKQLPSKKIASNNNFPILIGLGIIFLLGIIIYSNSFDCAFHLDDRNSIVENMAIRDLSDLQAIWNYSNSRFIAYYTFAVNYHFGELGVYGYHLFNLFIHLINAGLIYGLTLLIFSTPALKQYAITKDKNIIAFFTALLFVSHPLATGSVTYIVQRMSSLVTLFYLLSVVLFMKSRLTKKGNLVKYGMLAIALISAVLAMYTKQNAFTLPFAIILVEICFFQTKKFSMNLKDYRVLLIIAAFVGITLIVLSNYTLSSLFSPLPINEQNNFISITPKNYLFTQFSVIVKYIQLLILPINQNLDYDFRISNSFFEIRTLLSFLFLLSLVILAIFQYNKNRIISFGIYWFFLTLSIESSIIPISDVIFEHRTYLPSFGFFIVLSSVLYVLLWKKYKIQAIAILIIVIGSNSFMTYERNKIWKTELSLWNDVISKSPNKARPYNSRGTHFNRENKFDKAIQDFNKAIELQPNYALAYYNRGVVFRKENKFDSALEDYSKAIELNPQYGDAYYNRGLIFFNDKKYDIAVENYSQAIELSPKHFKAYTARGQISVMQEKYVEGIRDLSKAIELNPDYSIAYANRGVAEKNLGNREKACLDFKRAMELGLKQVEQQYIQNCQ